MNACISDSESKTPEEICDIISPSHLQDRCISIGQFTGRHVHHICVGSGFDEIKFSMLLVKSLKLVDSTF